MEEQMEYQGLWEEEKKQEPSIYKVTEFYEWHNSDPVIISTIFLNKGVAEVFYNQRVQDIPEEVWGYDEENIKDFVEIKEQSEGGLCIHNYNDYVHLSLESDRIHLYPSSELWSGD